MDQWEYRTLSVHKVSVSFTKTNGWRLKKINEQEQPEWKKTEVYPCIADLCNQMDEQGSFVSNESTLDVWEQMYVPGGRQELIARVKARYGVDITDEYEKPIPNILRIIAEKERL